jgi:hypothetical protein
MSPPSAPLTLMRLPERPPAAPSQAAITATKAAVPDGVALTIAIPDAPVARPPAFGPYRLAVWTQLPG